MMVSKRRGLLDYLRKSDTERYKTSFRNSASASKLCQPLKYRVFERIVRQFPPAIAYGALAGDPNGLWPFGNIHIVRAGTGAVCARTLGSSLSRLT